jgi:hypothetical protein
MNTSDLNMEMSNNKNFTKVPFKKEKLNYYTRISLYKDMLKYEPRMWTRNYHLFRLWTNIFTVNFTIYCSYKIYYKFCNKNEGFMSSIRRSHKMKFVLFSIILIDSISIYLNYFKLHDFVYDTYYSHISDEDFVKMHDSIVKFKKMKEQDHYQMK